MKKRILIALCALLVTGVMLGLLQQLLMPKYIHNPEGGLTQEYYAEAGGHDLLFVGDCEIYESFVPTVLWEKYGISSYVRGSAQQLVWQSYYLLEDALRYETPKAVVFNVLALKYGTPQDEAYNRMTLDGMKWSESKVDAIRASMTEEESFLDYVFPILRYHSRITELKGEDFRYAFDRPALSQCGYLMQTEIVPMEEAATEGRRPQSFTFSENAMGYLEKMRTLCEEKGIELILVKAPTNSFAYFWHDEWEAQIVEYATEKGLQYYNFIPLCEEIGIDWTTDTYDAGIHLNVYGAEKLSEFFGKILSEQHAIPDRRGDEVQASRWNLRVESYYNEKNEREGKNS